MADKKKQKTGPMRLDKFLGEMGYGTRTQIKEMVRKGRVQVNGPVSYTHLTLPTNSLV